MPKIKAMVVDDAVMMRKLISTIMEQDPDIEVIAKAPNGSVALQKVQQQRPDIITMDVEMPVMDGISCVREIRKLHKNIPIVMYSSHTTSGASKTLEALEAGASDFVTKPKDSGGLAETAARLEAELLPRIKQLCSKELTTSPESKKGLIFPDLPPKRKDPGFCVMRKKVELVVVGSSTGGPAALTEVFKNIPAHFPYPILVVQHMPPIFTANLAARLDKLCPLSFHEGQDGQSVQAGNVYIAPGGKHMTLARKNGQWVLSLNEDPPENSCRPAVDVLFRSVVPHCEKGILSVILTGMGKDGLIGCEHIRDAGGQVITQDEESSVVWGMPGYVTESGLSDSCLPLDQIAGEILKRAKVF